MMELIASPLAAVGGAIVLAVAGQSILHHAGRAAPVPLVIGLWCLALTVSIALMALGTRGPFDGGISEPLSLLGLISIVTFGAMSVEFVRILRSRERREIEARDL